MNSNVRLTVIRGAAFVLCFAAPASGRAQAVSGAASKAATSAPSDRVIAAKVDEYLNAAMKVKRFAGTVLIARSGKPVVDKGYGMANIEDGVANTPQTKFRLGSVTKQFTSMAVMMLQERGKLSVSDLACKYVPDCPAAWQSITIRNLLTHTSGIPNYTSLPDFRNFGRTPMTPAAIVDLFKNQPLDFAPGEKYSYSNSGYILLGYIIERVSGKSYQDFLRENIFGPLGMVNSGYDGTMLLSHRAAGYAFDAQSNSEINAAYIDMSVPFAAGALYSTVGDLLLWDQALYTERLLSKKSLDEMFTPFKSNYAYGWSVGKQFDRRSIAHGGDIYGFASHIARYPDDHVTVIVLTNHEGVAAGAIARDLAAIVFGAPYKIPTELKTVTVAPSVLESYVGQYRLASTVLDITNEGGKLMWTQGGVAESKRQLLPISETDFVLQGTELQIRFVKDSTGKVTQLNIPGAGMSAPKVK
jgi:CubicO group peptidase (beta-lactamase class C family)